VTPSEGYDLMTLSEGHDLMILSEGHGIIILTEGCRASDSEGRSWLNLMIKCSVSVGQYFKRETYKLTKFIDISSIMVENLSMSPV
jgi:hypothetical protein